jgi:transcription initiation factor IIE alpha subunit
MKVNCLSCGFPVSLDDAYDDYSGDIKCYVCGSMLEVIIEDERIKSVKLAAAGDESRHAR